MALKVLTALDHARTQIYHFKAIVVAGMGLFTDAYDLFCIVPVLKLIGRLYYSDENNIVGVTHPAIVSTIVGIALLGTVVGQLIFGFLGDKIGRRRVYGVSLLLMVCGSVGSGFSVCRTRTCVLVSLCFFRFLLGVGIGGDYPISATIMSEFANKRTRGSFIAAVFSMQGFGILASSAVTMVMSAVFSKAAVATKKETPEAADLLWRLILMFGAVPAALTYYWRMAMPETARFTALVEQDVAKATQDIGRVLHDWDLHTITEENAHPDDNQRSSSRPLDLSASYSIFSYEFIFRHGSDLFACAAAWFIVDIPYYSSTLFQSLIYEPWFPKPEHVTAYQEAYNVAKFQAIIAIASTIPGYWATVCFIDRVGRRPIQMMGFFFMALFLFALAGPYNVYWQHHTSYGFMVLYALTFFFSNFGPNTTTFIVPAELFPARFRTTCHGISGAAGKIGAIIGAIGFQWASQNMDKEQLKHGSKRGIGMMNALIILGGICIIGVVHTYFFTPETKGRSLEENESDGGRTDVVINGIELRRNGSESASHQSISPLL